MDHKPVLIEKIIQVLQNNFACYAPNQTKKVMDCTFGAGGYTSHLLNADENIFISALDQDPLAFSYWEKIEQDFPGRSEFFNTNFAQIYEKLITQDATKEQQRFDAIIFDLGVSSMQLDDKSRGFSFGGEESRLDMRMNPQAEIETAYEFVNYASERELADVIYYYGGEERARKIARRIVDKRMDAPIETTLQLASLVASVIGYRKNHSSNFRKNGPNIHPATKTFQAIRIHVNKELENLMIALQDLVKLLKPGGMMIVVSFHSLEDKIVKSFFNFMNNALFVGESNAEAIRNFTKIYSDKEFLSKSFFKVDKNLILPDAQEIEHNIRARSAKMRVLHRIS